MPTTDGLPEQQNDSPRPLDESGSFGLDLSSFHGSSEENFGFRNRRVLTKSRSISASKTRDDSATLRFPGPLLPTVRRLNSSPASSKPGTRDIGDAVPTSGRLENINAGSDHASPANGNPAYNDADDDEPIFEELKTTSSIFCPRTTHGRNGHAEGVKPEVSDDSQVFMVGGESDASTIDSPKASADASPSPKPAIKYRPRIETDGNVSSLMPPAKTQRTAADQKARSDRFKHSTTFGEHSFANHRTYNRFKTPASKPDVAPVLKPPQPSIFSAQMAEAKRTHDNVQPRRRRIPENSSSRPSSDAWLNEIIRVPQTGANSTQGSVSTLPPSKPTPSRLASLVRWPLGQNRTFPSNMVLNLLIIVCASTLLYAVNQHQQILFLKRENARLTEYIIRSSDTEESCIQFQQRSIKSDIELEVPSDGNNLKFLLYVLVLVACGSFVVKYGTEIRLIKMPSDNKGTEERVPISKRVAYLVDVLFSTHPYAKAVALLLATLLLIAFGGFSLSAVSDENLSDALWRSWTYVADSGNHADSTGLGPRIVSVSISIGGMLIFALMLGLISDAISEKVDSLRKGKSEVIESNHTLILGWSDKLGSLLKQLAIANQSLGGGVVVVLAERDKEVMELDIAKLEFDFMGTSVICRSGSPLILADLKKVSVSKARSIIVLAEVENADQSDARALRVVLSLTAVKEGLRGHIVVELSDLDNEPLVKLVGDQVVETVVAHDVIGRLMIQCARQPGLAQIWEDILGFDNAEFYIKRWPQLDGMRFEDVLVSFPEAIPCGVKVAAEQGKIILNPDDDYILCEGDELLVIAEDDDTYAPAPLPQIRRGYLPKVINPPKLPERILFCGWRRDIHDMIKVLDAFLPSGSELWIFSDVHVEEREKKLLEGNLETPMNLKLEHREGNPVIRRHLESLPLQTFDSILILADEKLEENVVVADSRSLATLLLIRDIQSKRLPLNASTMTQRQQPGFRHSSWIGEMQQASDKSIIISEILDSRTKHLVSVSQIGDYVLSNELVSMALAMVAEEKQINRVLEELFAEEGNELYIRSAEFYLYDQEELSFFEVMIRARQRQEIVIGYRRASQERAIINPPDKAAVQKWSIEDVFVVLSWDE